MLKLIARGVVWSGLSLIVLGAMYWSIILWNAFWGVLV